MEEKKKKFPWKPVTAVVLCLALTAGLLWFNIDPNMHVYGQAPLTAEQVDAQLPSVLGYMGMYTETCYPSEAQLELAELPRTAYLPVYQQFFTQPSEEKLRTLIDEVVPALETLHAIEIPTPTIEQDEDVFDGIYYQASATVGGKKMIMSSSANRLCARWRNEDNSPLEINGSPLCIQLTQTDEQIIQTLSSAITQLEQAFGVELSAHQITRQYSRSDGALCGISVTLFSADAKIDETLESYSGDPDHYLSGDYFSLYFDKCEDAPNNAACSWIWYYKSQQVKYDVYGKYRTLSLYEAEWLLNKGYRFMFQYCPDCSANDETPDFSDYDHVTLEYVFGDEDSGFGIPFYVFYKQTSEDQFAKYITTMVPAVHISGLDQFFNAQKAYQEEHADS